MRFRFSGARGAGRRQPLEPSSQPKRHGGPLRGERRRRSRMPWPRAGSRIPPLLWRGEWPRRKPRPRPGGGLPRSRASSSRRVRSLGSGWGRQERRALCLRRVKRRVGEARAGLRLVFPPHVEAEAASAVAVDTGARERASDWEGLAYQLILGQRTKRISRWGAVGWSEVAECSQGARRGAAAVEAGPRGRDGGVDGN